MSAEQLRKIKHELRTPVNHIIGYSELLMETAIDEGDLQVSERAKEIYDYGQSLAAIIDGQLAGLAEQHRDISSILRTSAMPVISAILASAKGRDHANPVWERDFERIEAASQKLMILFDVHQDHAMLNV